MVKSTLIHDANMNSEEYYGAATGPFTATAEMDDLADLVVKKLPPDLVAKQQAQNAYINDVRERSKSLTWGNLRRSWRLRSG